jgi:hypothetical protein
MDVVQTWEDVQQISVAHGRVLVVAAYGWSSHSQRFLAAIGNAEESFIVQRVRLAFFQLEDFEHAWRVCPPVALAWLDGYLEPSFFLFDEGRCSRIWFNESNLFRQVGATPFDCSGGVWGASFQGLHSVDDCVSRLEPTMRRLLDFRMLDLRGTDVTDRALKLLLETGLRILYLNGTAVTEAGKNELASALPSLHIEWGTLQNWQCIRK